MRILGGCSPNSCSGYSAHTAVDTVATHRWVQSPLHGGYSPHKSGGYNSQPPGGYSSHSPAGTLSTPRWVQSSTPVGYSPHITLCRVRTTSWAETAPPICSDRNAVGYSPKYPVFYSPYTLVQPSPPVGRNPHLTVGTVH
jgi:hypothetical protein